MRTVWILIRLLRQKPADLDVQCVKKGQIHLNTIKPSGLSNPDQFAPLNSGWVAMGFSRGVQGNLHLCDFPGVGWGCDIGFLRNTEYWYGAPLSCVK